MFTNTLAFSSKLILLSREAWMRSSQVVRFTFRNLDLKNSKSKQNPLRTSKMITLPVIEPAIIMSFRHAFLALSHAFKSRGVTLHRKRGARYFQLMVSSFWCQFNMEGIPMWLFVNNLKPALTRWLKTI